MVRDLDRLTARTFDLVVVGGGIQGLTIAYDAAQRGLTTALIDRSDFGSGASFNHLRTIHGGLRYLQTLDFSRARESLRERRTLARIAPQTLRPMPFVLPLRPALLTGKTAMRAGFALDRCVARDRNAGVPESLRLPAGRVVSTSEAARFVPRLFPRGASGAALWYDYVAVQADRLTFAFAVAAHEHGAALANYVEATTLLSDGTRVTGARVRDALTGREFEIGSRLVVNATGASIDRLLQPLGHVTGTPLLKAMNLVTRLPAENAALGGRSAAGRHFFLVPWHGRAVLGTWESKAPVDASATSAMPVEVDQFVREVNEAFPALELSDADVTLVHRGVVPAVLVAPGRVKLEGHTKIFDHRWDGVEGVLSVAATKYTTARAVAEQVVDLCVSRVSSRTTPCRTATTPLPVELAGAGPVAQENSESLIPPSGNPPVAGAQLVRAVRDEMAVTLADAVVRRTLLGAFGYPGDEVLRRAAHIVGHEQGWSDDRMRAEIEIVRRFYERAAGAS